MHASSSSRDPFVDLCERNPSGVTEDIAAANGWSKDSFLEDVNRLLKEDRIKLFRDPDGKVICRVISQPEKYKGLSEHDRLVLGKIKEAGDRGIMSKDVAHKTSLATQVVNRCMKVLEAKDIVKAVKSIQSKRGKVWMLFDITPSKEIAGGSWYKDGEFDQDKITQMRNEVLQILSQRAEPQTAESLSVANDRDEDDVRQILRVLELDDVISAQATLDASRPTYKIKKPVDVFFECGEMPCFSCPVRSRCTTRPAGPNVPTPRNCEYLTRWLYGRVAEPAGSVRRPMDIEETPA